MNAYEAKQEARRTRLENAAARARRDAAQHEEAGAGMLAVIPMGQPILVGHHSEGRDRRYRERAFSKLQKAHEGRKRAEVLERKAAAVGNGGVSSDDPDAIEKLRGRLAKLKEDQARMVDTNKLVRKGDRAGLAAMGHSERTIANLFEPDFAGRPGIPDYALKNNGANIRRLKKRIAELEAKATEPERQPVEGDGFQIVEDRDINRCCIEFDEKPPAERRRELKRHGFRWSPTRGAWVRQLTNGAWYAAQLATRPLG